MRFFVFKLEAHVLLLVTFICSFSTSFFSQNEVIISVDWNTTPSAIESFSLKSIRTPDRLVFYGGELLVEYDFLSSLKANDLVGNILSYEQVSDEEQYSLLSNGWDFPLNKSDLLENFHFSASKVLFCPFFEREQRIYRIKSVAFKPASYSRKPSLQKDFVSQSVLQDGSGNWYKIAITQDGIHKVTGAFLQSIGISLSGLPSNSINVYGNGEGKLPESNSVSRTDDLAKNAILMMDGGDGMFDASDYFLFYAKGPHRWYANGTAEFEQIRNCYTDISTYFININSSALPLRISNAIAEAGVITNAIDSYSFYDCYENDFVNLVKGGQRWYGEKFDIELERTFDFNVPDVVSGSSISFRSSLATNASTSGNSQVFSVNGNTLLSASLPVTSYDYVQSVKNFSYPNASSSIPLKLKINRVNGSVITYLDRILLNARRNLVMINGQFGFRDLTSVSPGNMGLFTIANCSSNSQVWDVTDTHVPKIVATQFSAGTLTFQAALDSLREFIAYDGGAFTPVFIEKIQNQNLHGLIQADMLIITPNDFQVQAERLAELHRAEGLDVHVVDIQKIYNEFSSGMLDPTAIKMFVKMFYDRAQTIGQPPKYLLLFGDGTYDPKGKIASNVNFIPTYQFPNSENSISALVSDDYYGLLDDSEGMAGNDILDVGVGRLLVNSISTAKQQVDKIEHYMKNGSSLYADNFVSTFGDWRLNYVQIADDEEGGYFVNQDTEPHYNYVKNHHPEMNSIKIYSDAYVQQTSAGGERYPDVNLAIDDWVRRGTLILNYVGHGGEKGFAQERILTIDQIQNWDNKDKLNLLVSATCEFTRFDDPERYSAGELASLNPSGGSIALMTTTRSVFFGVNSITGEQFYENVFQRDSDGLPARFGDIIRATKNASGTSDNKRSFTLIGDPALRIALPTYYVKTDSINGVDNLVILDTVKALSKMVVKGHVEDLSGQVMTSFNGKVYPTIFDKAKIQQTLGQDPDSPVIPFEVQRNIIYKGQATVQNGYFQFEFIVPKDISYSIGRGRISYYANSSMEDAGDVDTAFLVGGISSSGIIDDLGPEIDLTINDDSFVDGGLTDNSPILIAKLFDENGINTVGNGIGHDMTAILDASTSDPFVLNEYYVADVDTYKSGTVNYELNDLSEGEHVLSLKAWDVTNNSSEAQIRFVVSDGGKVTLKHVLNYPNPFTTSTAFFFEHNQPGQALQTQIQIFTVGGRLVKTINEEVVSTGYRSDSIVWDGRDDFGDPLAKGVYIYRISVTNTAGEKEEAIEKLVLLR